MRKLMICFWLASLAVSSGTWADESREEMRSLDDQVQEIKSDVLGIASELAVLEERLLFPSNTQVTVFLDLGDGEDFRLDAVRLDVDDELATHHIYSFKELEALQQGGVQRLYMGNLPTGSHEIEVAVLGKLPSGKEFSRTQRFSVSKDVEPLLLGITVAPHSSEAPIDLKSW